MLSFLRKTILPPRCLVCSGKDQVIQGVCSRCRSGIRPLPGPLCDICGKVIGTPGTCLQCQHRPPHFNKVLSACVYEGMIQDIIHRFKYRRATVYKKFLAGLVAERITADGAPFDFVTEVPLHWSRLIERGYNQSMLIARELSGYLGSDVRYGVLRKVRKTPSQVGLPRTDRQRNLRDAFSARGVEGKSVVVVDDVITTGKTAQEVSKALKNAGAAYVIFASVGRTVSW